MTTKREKVLAALYSRIQGLGGGASVLRNAVLPEKIPRGGLVILRDGNPGEPEVTLSPLAYHYEHRAEIEVLVRDSGGVEAAFDALASAIGSRLASDRTLGGLCDWAEPAAPEPADLVIDGAAPIRAAVLTVTLHYTSDDPLA